MDAEFSVSVAVSRSVEKKSAGLSRRAGGVIFFIFFFCFFLVWYFLEKARFCSKLKRIYLQNWYYIIRKMNESCFFAVGLYRETS